MIRLYLKPSIIKSLSFNKRLKTLDVQFKKHIKTTDCLNIPLSVLQEYVETIRSEEGIENDDSLQSNLKVVYSNFKAS
ncbi:hypothetical protein [uncultured Algibacter sp.]|uniref:hypothetical protein n=1 Tax=uncultured Algibacter sp. TaxID=298659 RepID=UPI00261C6077|nr:hypothetical protein [uncultured Algibacter sp.]